MSNEVAINLEEYSTLLEEYSRLPKTRRERTFMEIAGRSHLENPVSNVLAFFLHPGEIHGMGRLVLDSLLELIGEAPQSQERMHDNQTDFDHYTVTREESTETRKRMDIVVRSSDVIIGIEVKVNHHANNNFSEYSEHLYNISNGVNNIHKILLGKEKFDTVPSGNGFVSVSYNELWKNVSPKIENNKKNYDLKWRVILEDFIQQTQNFNSPKTHMNDQKLKFFSQESKRIAALKIDIDAFQFYIISRICEIRKSLTECNFSSPTVKVIRKDKNSWFTNTYSSKNIAGRVVLTLFWKFDTGWRIHFVADSSDKSKASINLRSKIVAHSSDGEGINVLLPGNNNENYRCFDTDTDNGCLLSILLKAQEFILEAMHEMDSNSKIE